MRPLTQPGDPPSPQQQRVLDFIKDELKRRHIPPTQEEISARLDLSIGTIRDYLRHLEDKGYIKRHMGIIRGIELLAPLD